MGEHEICFLQQVIFLAGLMVSTCHMIDRECFLMVSEISRPDKELEGVHIAGLSVTSPANKRFHFKDRRQCS